MRALVMLVLLLASACTHVQIGGTSNVSAAPANAAGLQVQGGGVLTAVVLAGMLAAAATQDLREPMGMRPRSEMKPDRIVVEQDCTKPIELTENLRCR